MVTRSVAESDGPAPGPDVRGGEQCPSCDAPAAWHISRRHRFSPFGSVLLAVLAFWSAVFAALLGFGFTLSLCLLALAVFVALLTRKAEVCESCGFVRPQER